jgi:hypothetical protein
MSMRRLWGTMAGFAVVMTSMAGCATASVRSAVVLRRPPASTTPSVSVSPTPAPTPKPSPSRKPAPRPTVLKTKVAPGGDIGRPAPSPTPPPSDGVPTHGGGTFTVASGGTPVVGTGTTLVTYRVELEDGITWGANPMWTSDSFASTVDGILADPRGWTASAAAPITDAAQHLTNASWSFQRVSGATYSVRVLLATPNTVDAMCGTVGLTTQGIYSCRYGTTILINLRRWLKGAPGFPIDLTGYHTMVINHEMGHLLGFDHMLCPGAGQPAPVMQQQTIVLGGCTPNAYPFAADGTFIHGPWAAS